MIHSLKFYSSDVAYEMIKKEGRAACYGAIPTLMFQVKRTRKHKIGRVYLNINSYRTLKDTPTIMVDRGYILDETGECERIAQKYRKYFPYEPF